MSEFFKISSEYLEFVLRTESHISNYKPILWNHKGTYGWIPIEIVKNEIETAKLKNKKSAKFTWQQVYPLRPDVGKILEELGNE